MKLKILVVIQDISKAQEHEWFVEYMNHELFDISFVLINGRNSVMEKFLDERNIPVYHLNYLGKSDLPKLVIGIYRLLISGRFQIIHTHLFEATLAGLTAAWLARTPSRIYTRHYSDYHHVWFPSAVKYDRYNNRLATAIIATSVNVSNILINMERVSAGKVNLIHHGIDMTDYYPGSVSKERVSAVMDKYDLNGLGPVIGAISRFTELKGLQYLIPAFKEILEIYPRAVLVLANASGDYHQVINNLLGQLPASSYRKILFENDIAALYRVFNCFVHIPITATAEAFGQTYLEALASRVPSVFTSSGVAPEFINDREHALIVPFCDQQAVKNAILYVLGHPDEAAAMTERGYNTVLEKFDIHRKITSLEKLYKQLG